MGGIQLTTEEKIYKIKLMTANTLLLSYDYIRDHWNPIDDDQHETYNLIKNEMIERMDNGRG